MNLLKSCTLSNSTLRRTVRKLAIFIDVALRFCVRLPSSFASAAFLTRSIFTGDNSLIAAASSAQVRKFPVSVSAGKDLYTSCLVNRPHGSVILVGAIHHPDLPISLTPPTPMFPPPV